MVDTKDERITFRMTVKQRRALSTIRRARRLSSLAEAMLVVLAKFDENPPTLGWEPPINVFDLKVSKLDRLTMRFTVRQMKAIDALAARHGKDTRTDFIGYAIDWVTESEAMERKVDERPLKCRRRK